MLTSTGRIGVHSHYYLLASDLYRLEAIVQTSIGRRGVQSAGTQKHFILNFLSVKKRAIG